jgi:hypothetical protein
MTNFANTPEDRGNGRFFKLMVRMSEIRFVSLTVITAGHIMFGQYHKTDIPTSTDVGFVVDRVVM